MAKFLVTLLCILAGLQVTQSRPKNMGHRSVYDEWKTVPFVKNQDEAKSTFGQYLSLGSSNTTSKTHDEYIQYYKKYNEDQSGNVNGGNGMFIPNGSESDKDSLNNNDTDIVPVQGGLEDMNDGPRELLQKSKNRIGTKKNRDNNKNRRHGKKLVKKELKKDEKLVVYANDETFLSSQDYESDSLFAKFLSEHPDFKKNVATITDNNEVKLAASTAAISTTLASTTGEITTTTATIDESISDDADDDDANDNLKNPNLESQFHDASSEMNKHYDYYNENGDSSYSSSEQAAEAGMQNGKPFDWLKDYDKMHADQSPKEEDNTNEKEAYQLISDTGNEKETKNIQLLKDAESIINTVKDNSKISGDHIPKTSVEPSTSPNPPTSKTDIRLTVTKPTYPEWHQRVDTWNLIESKPAEACSENWDCPEGRMCKFGLCLCGQPDFCDGHHKPVCGSDGLFYLSHCELHRTACVLGVHILIDHKELCMIQNDNDEMSKNIDVPAETEDKNEAVSTVQTQILNLDRNNLEDAEVIQNFEEANNNLKKTDVAPDIVDVDQTTMKASNIVDKQNDLHTEMNLHDKVNDNTSNEVHKELPSILVEKSDHQSVFNKSKTKNGLEIISEEHTVLEKSDSKSDLDISEGEAVSEKSDATNGLEKSGGKNNLEVKSDATNGLEKSGGKNNLEVKSDATNGLEKSGGKNNLEVKSDATNGLEKSGGKNNLEVKSEDLVKITLIGQQVIENNRIINNNVKDDLKENNSDESNNYNFTLISKSDLVVDSKDKNSTLNAKSGRIIDDREKDDDDDYVVDDRNAEYKYENEKVIDGRNTFTANDGDHANSAVDDIKRGSDSSLVPQFCTPDLYMKFKADVLQYHCIFFEESHCDRQTQEDKQKLAAVMFNYFDRDFSGSIEPEELWEMQLREHMDDTSTVCSLLDLVTFDELGKRNGKLSVDEFIQAFDIPDLIEHSIEVVPLLANIGNGLEMKCDVTDTTDVVWTRNDFDLSLLDFPGIIVLEDGSLFLDSVGFHHVGNLSCYDRKKPSVVQIRMLTVQSSPHVVLSLKTHEWNNGNKIELHCHAEGYPKPSITWLFEDKPIHQGAKYHIHGYDNILTVNTADYMKDTGIYKCRAQNMAGVGEASAAITVHSPNNSLNPEVFEMEESFVIFHNDGYTLHEPSKCLTQRHVKPDFNNFHSIGDDLDTSLSLCNPRESCMWGEVINVKDTFLYAAQPKQNRILVIDLKYTFNPYQVIKTDCMPVSLHYMSYLDEVWVVCWNSEEDDGAKTPLIIRNASQKSQHYTAHTQPIGNMFDMVQDLFLPPNSELHHPYKYGYIVHHGQQGLFKINLEEKKYTRAVDFTNYDCVPKDMAFVPLGGHMLVTCEKTYGTQMELLTMDLITDTVVANITTNAVPYVSPDVSLVVFVDEQTGKISVHDITENGEIMHKFDVTVGSPVGMATFQKASYNHGYDLYLVSVGSPAVFAVNIETGKIDSIKDVGAFDSEMLPPWLHRHLVPGDVFSNYLATTTNSSFLILNSQQHNIQCDYKDLHNPAVIVFAHLNKLS